MKPVATTEFKAGAWVKCVDATDYDGMLRAGKRYRVHEAGMWRGREPFLYVETNDGNYWLPAARFALDETAAVKGETA